MGTETSFLPTSLGGPPQPSVDELERQLAQPTSNNPESKPGATPLATQPFANQAPGGLLTQKAKLPPQPAQAASTSAKDLGKVSISLQEQFGGVSGPRVQGWGQQSKVTVSGPLDKRTTWNANIAVGTYDGKLFGKPASGLWIGAGAGLTHKVPLGKNTSLSLTPSAGVDFNWKDGSGLGKAPFGSDGFIAFSKLSASFDHKVISNGKFNLAVSGEVFGTYTISGDGVNPSSSQLRAGGKLGLQADFDTDPSRPGTELRFSPFVSFEGRYALNGARSGEWVSLVPSVGVQARYNISSNLSVTASATRTFNVPDDLRTTSTQFWGTAANSGSNSFSLGLSVRF